MDYDAFWVIGVMILMLIAYTVIEYLYLKKMESKKNEH